MRLMDHAPPPKLRNGQPYTGNQMFAGQGVKRSCGKCGVFVPTQQVKKLAPWGMCCQKCRG